MIDIEFDKIPFGLREKILRRNSESVVNIGGHDGIQFNGATGRTIRLAVVTAAGTVSSMPMSATVVAFGCLIGAAVAG